MTRVVRSRSLLAACLTGLVVQAAAGWGVRAQSPPLAPAADVIRAAIVARLGAGVDVTIANVDQADATRVYREARPDPSARLGKPIRFSLIPAVGPSVTVTATLSVVADQVVTRGAVNRGQVLTAADVDLVRTELRDLPLRRLPTLAQLAGARALRPIDKGAIVLSSFVAVHRAVEPGDHVTVMAISGSVSVSATFIAADGGEPGDVIRVVNPETRKYMRGRVVKQGLVEVMYER